MSDRGGGSDLVNINLTFDDNAASSLPASTQITSGTYKPCDDNGPSATDTFPSPAPPAPHPTLGFLAFLLALPLLVFHYFQLWI